MRSYGTRGRAEAEEECSLRTPFQRDRDRIVHAKAFRRLKHKTQVFIAPEGDHYRTRLTHTLEVVGIARTVARALQLNEDLTEAIALGHDLGHPPFGHAGEEALYRRAGGRHGPALPPQRALAAHRRAPGARRPRPEPHARGRGTASSTTRGRRAPETLEGRIVKLVDRVAYINHDIDDAIRAGVLDPERLPADEVALLGATARARIDRFVHDLVENSSQIRRYSPDPPDERVAPDAARVHVRSRSISRHDGDDERRRVRHVVSSLFGWFLARAARGPERRPGRASSTTWPA